MEVKPSPTNYDFAGWATVSNRLCSDGRTIMPDAFKHQDGAIVPLVWNHQHNDPTNVLGNALLHSRDGGLYAYCLFNDTETGKVGKELVRHGDVCALSICANQLKHNTSRGVTHGMVREVSLVMAGANPGAFIETINIQHGDNAEEEAVIYSGEMITLYHADEAAEKEDTKVAEETKKSDGDKTIKEIIDAMTEEQQNAVYALVGMVAEGADEKAEHSADSDSDETLEHSEGGEEDMKTNTFDVFENKTEKANVLTHADQMAIIEMAKKSNVGSFKEALRVYAEEKGMLAHSEDGVGVFEDYGVLFPELELLKKGEPETLYKYDQTWVAPALAKIHKSPYSRIRTRFADARIAELRAKGYQKKGNEKTIMGQIKMIGRETTPQTIYIKDALHRDDVIDITDFSIVDYQYKQMRVVLNETMVMAAMVGDQREDGDPDKISEEHIRPIWKDNDEYTIHCDVDIEAAREELQGSNTGANFGENYIYAEAIITAALYSREKFKGTGTPDFYCTPHLVNVMLLARDLNGRRIYDSKADLAKALNCNSIVEVEQFEGLTRTTEEGKTKKLLGLFVNLNDYTFGSTKGGEITKFEDFDMDFNLMKFLLEARLSGSLYKLKSAIALEEPVEA